MAQEGCSVSKIEIHDQRHESRWSLYNGDTVKVARELGSETVGLSVFSPPFSSLFVYSSDPHDFGNVKSDAEFFAQYAFLVREQFRIMKPGGIVAIHCMDLPTSKTRDGYIGLRDFPGDLIRAYQAAGFIYHSRVCIWKCPVVAVQRTKALGLLHKQLCKDSSMSRQGIPDSLIVMRKPGERVPRVAHDHLNGDVFGARYSMTHPLGKASVEQWQMWASPVWAVAGRELPDGFLACEQDIDYGETLNARVARDHRDEAHLAPLQLEIIRRCVMLWSAPDDVVHSPFAGVGSEGWVALELGRRFVGAELKPSYYRQAVKNLEQASTPARQQSLFDVAEEVTHA
jgi:hypothetical protein